MNEKRDEVRINLYWKNRDDRARDKVVRKIR